jgi:hypothetical protein
MLSLITLSKDNNYSKQTIWIQNVANMRRDELDRPFPKLVSIRFDGVKRRERGRSLRHGFEDVLLFFQVSKVVASQQETTRGRPNFLEKSPFPKSEISVECHFAISFAMSDRAFSA